MCLIERLIAFETAIDLHQTRGSTSKNLITIMEVMNCLQCNVRIVFLIPFQCILLYVCQ